MPGFTKVIQDALLAAGIKCEPDDDGEHLNVAFEGDMTGKVNLQNFLDYHRAGMSMDEVVRKIVGAISLATGKQPFDWTSGRDKLRIHIVSHDTVPPGCYARDVSPLLCETLIIDEPEHILYVTEDDVKSSGRDLESFWLAAEFNMTANAPQPEEFETSRGETVFVWSGSLGADYAWHWARRQPRAAAAMPVRDFGFAVADPSREELQYMAVAALNPPNPNVHPISPVVHILENGKSVSLLAAHAISIGDRGGDGGPH